jgi:predicted phage terminase large subunit-like protein
MLPELDEVQMLMAERSLSRFIRLGWPNIDPADYITNWHIDATAEYLEDVANGGIRKLIINMPPRHMKSLSVSVAWPAWVWAQAKRSALTGPQVGFLTACYAQSLSVRDSVKCRRLIQSPWYQRQWGDRFGMASDQNTKIKWENDKGGYRIASSVDGTATGEGGDIIIIDDPVSARDALSPTVRQSANDWFDGTMTTRLNNPKTGAYVVVMQRLHEDDLVGHLLDKDRGEWEVLCLPARYEHEHPHVWARDPRKENGTLLWPARVGEKEVKSLETALGSYGTAGQLQQRPAPSEGGMFQRSWFEIVDVLPTGLEFVRDWDLAGTVPAPGRDPDWTVGAKLARCPKGFYYIVDLRRLQGSPQKVEETILTTAREDGYSCTVSLKQDPGQAGKAQVQALTRMLAGYTVTSATETGSKETRASPFSAQCEAGNVKLLRGHWNHEFLDEACVFPFGKHDDQVDATASGFNVLAGRSGGSSWLAMMDMLDDKRELEAANKVGTHG